MKKYMIKLNGKVYEVEIEEVTGETATTLAESDSSSQKQSVPTHSKNIPQSSAWEVLEAPMPGTILQVSAKVGDTVKTGDVLFVLEAMKMENEIVSPVNGKIMSVNVTKGQTVNAGDHLVQIA